MRWVNAALRHWQLGFVPFERLDLSRSSDCARGLVGRERNIDDK